jgi:hypothetical protein
MHSKGGKRTNSVVIAKYVILDHFCLFNSAKVCSALAKAAI